MMPRTVISGEGNTIFDPEGCVDAATLNSALSFRKRFLFTMLDIREEEYVLRFAEKSFKLFGEPVRESTSTREGYSGADQIRMIPVIRIPAVSNKTKLRTDSFLSMWTREKTPVDV